MTPIRAALSVIAALSPVSAFAGGPALTAPEPVIVAPAPMPSGNALSFTLRGGASVSPDYFGSKDYSVGPDLGFSLNHLKLGGFEIGSADPYGRKQGFGVHGAFRYIGKRSASDNSELTGLDDVKAAAELGLGVDYTTDYFSAFADVRYGAIGHHSFVGEVGADLILHPSDRVTLTLGPRVQIGSAKFNQTYFGVTPAESLASGLGAYNAGSGVYGAGLELGATYQINDNWGVEGAATWTRLNGEAGDSPIVAQGDKDQFGVRIGLTRRVTFGF